MTLERAAAPRTVLRFVIAIALALGLVAAFVMLRTRSPDQQPAAKQHATTTTTCERDPASKDFQVCVVDEAGKPLAGVLVFAAYTRYGGSGPYTDGVSAVTTDARGLATFKRPPFKGSADLRPMWAIAERVGWPAQAEVEPGRIVLGPPRSLHGVVRFATKCRRPSARIGVNNRWESGFGQPKPTYLHVDLDGDERAFTFENLGPGIYHLSVSGCEDYTDLQSWSGDIRGSELAGRTIEVPLALDAKRR